MCCGHNCRFRGMCQAVEDKVQDVLIGKVVENVLPFAPASDNVVGAKNAKALRDYRDGLTLELRQLRDARLSPRKPRNQPDPCRLAQRTENSCCTFDGRFVDRHLEPLRSMLLGRTSRV